MEHSSIALKGPNNIAQDKRRGDSHKRRPGGMMIKNASPETAAQAHNLNPRNALPVTASRLGMTGGPEPSAYADG